MKGKNKNAKEDEIKEQIAVEDAEQDNEKLIDREEMTDEEYIGCLEEKLGASIAEAAECRQLTQRLQADFDNYRKRNASIAEDMKQIGVSAVAEKLLAVLDNCALARKYVTDESALTGFNMMENQIVSVLEGFGLQEINAEGEPFDAKVMSAVERVKAEGMEGKVTEVVLRGYLLKGKLLRPASVKVGAEA